MALYEPLARVTDPVGVGCPLTPLTATATLTAWSSAMLEDDGVTVKLGVSRI
jgi:hypothetical protein